MKEENCEHYWVKLKSDGLYYCLRCWISQNVDASTMHVNNSNWERVIEILETG